MPLSYEGNNIAGHLLKKCRPQTRRWFFSSVRLKTRHINMSGVILQFFSTIHRIHSNRFLWLQREAEFRRRVCFATSVISLRHGSRGGHLPASLTPFTLGRQTQDSRNGRTLRRALQGPRRPVQSRSCSFTMYRCPIT